MTLKFLNIEFSHEEVGQSWGTGHAHGYSFLLPVCLVGECEDVFSQDELQGFPEEVLLPIFLEGGGDGRCGLLEAISKPILCQNKCHVAIYRDA